MGIKQTKAISRLSGFDVVLSANCQKKDNDDYFCPTKGCDAPLTLVESSTKQFYDKRVDIPAYFNLKSGFQHKIGICPYNISDKIEKIIRVAPELFILSKFTRKYEFNLHDISFFESINTIDSPKEFISHKKGSTAIDTNMEELFINTMHKLLNLCYCMEDIAELSPFMELKLGHMTIPWNQFYFEIDDYEHLFSVAYRLSNKYPMAISGIVEKVSRLSSPVKSFQYPVVKLVSPDIQPIGEVKYIPKIQLLFPIKNFDDKIKVGSKLIVYGTPHLSNLDNMQTNVEKPNIQIENISFWIASPQQILVI